MRAQGGRHRHDEVAVLGGKQCGGDLIFLAPAAAADGIDAALSERGFQRAEDWMRLDETAQLWRTDVYRSPRPTYTSRFALCSKRDRSARPRREQGGARRRPPAPPGLRPSAGPRREAPHHLIAGPSTTRPAHHKTSLQPGEQQ